jgi:hypothetical protein
MQIRTLSRGLALLAAVFVPALTSAQGAQPPSASATGVVSLTKIVSKTEQLDELQIVGRKLYRIRMGAVDVEDRFYALYNDLNQNDEFDIHCKVEAPTGTLLKVRICRLALYEKALEEEARAYLTGMDSPPPAQLVALSRLADYRENALTLINSHPQLRELISQREALEKKYWVARKWAARQPVPVLPQ